MGRNIPKNRSHQVIDEETRAQRGSEADRSHAEDTELLSRDRQPAPEPALSARKWDALVSPCPGPITGAAAIAKDRTLLLSATPQLLPWLFDVSLKWQPPESLQVVTPLAPQSLKPLRTCPTCALSCQATLASWMTSSGMEMLEPSKPISFWAFLSSVRWKHSPFYSLGWHFKSFSFPSQSVQCASITSAYTWLTSTWSVVCPQGDVLWV